MTTINPWINFNGNALEAFTFYKSVFGGEFKKVLKASKNLDVGTGAVDAGVFADGEAPGRRNPIRWLVISGILLIVAIAIGTAVMIANFRDHALASSTRELENTTLLLARHFDQELDDVEVPLVDLAEQIRQAGVKDA